MLRTVRSLPSLRLLYQQEAATLKGQVQAKSTYSYTCGELFQPSTTAIRNVHQTAKKETILLDSSSEKSRYTTMNLQGLKMECKKRGLKVSGRKLDLVQRLVSQDQLGAENSRSFTNISGDNTNPLNSSNPKFSLLDKQIKESKIAEAIRYQKKHDFSVSHKDLNDSKEVKNKLLKNSSLTNSAMQSMKLSAETGKLDKTRVQDVKTSEKSKYKVDRKLTDNNLSSNKTNERRSAQLKLQAQKRDAEKKAFELRVQADRRAAEVKLQREREAREFKLQAEKKAAELKLQREREAQELKLQAERRAAEKKAAEMKLQREREAHELKLRAEKRAAEKKAAKMKLQKEREAQEFKLQAEKEATEMKLQRERETEEVKLQAERKDTEKKAAELQMKEAEELKQREASKKADLQTREKVATITETIKQSIIKQSAISQILSKAHEQSKVDVVASAKRQLQERAKLVQLKEQQQQQQQKEQRKEQNNNLNSRDVKFLTAFGLSTIGWWSLKESSI